MFNPNLFYLMQDIVIHRMMSSRICRKANLNLAVHINQHREISEQISATF